MSYKTKKILGLFILNEGGSCIYERFFTQQFDTLPVDLLGSFFSAIWGVSKTLMSENIDAIDLGKFRFIFSAKDDFLFILLSTHEENLLFIHNILKKISEAFLHGIIQLGWVVSMVIKSKEFDLLIETLILGEDEVLQFKSKKGYFKILEFIENLRSESKILGAALITENGNTLFSNLSNEIFSRAMKELEIRYKSQGLHIKDHLYTLENGQRISERNIQIEGFPDFILFMHFPHDINTILLNNLIESSIKEIITELF
jgi:hypothetical protein